MSGTVESMTRELHAVSRKLLEEGEVAAVIGYGAGSWGQATRPLFVTSAEQSASLIWNRYCAANLMVYLNRKPVRRLGRLAIVAKGCDLRSLTVLVQENQLRREDVVVVGVGCEGVVDPAGADEGRDLLPKCHTCTVQTPVGCDHLIGSPQPAPEAGVLADPVAAIDGMTADERWRYWVGELDRCVKCFACRAVCPQCYCERCFVEATRPAWTSSNQSRHANYVFHLFRAFHLAGRCVGCGECARVCPQHICLGTLNSKMAREVERLYGHVAGVDADSPAPLLAHSDDDVEDFIR